MTQTLKLQLNIKDKVSLVNISHKYPLAEFTFEANTISQVKWLFQEKKTTEEKISEITQILLSEVLTEYESKS